MAQTAEKFMEKDVLPNLEALEEKEEDLTPKLFRKAGDLGLLGIEVPTDFDGLGLGKVRVASALQHSRVANICRIQETDFVLVPIGDLDLEVVAVSDGGDNYGRTSCG